MIARDALSASLVATVTVLRRGEVAVEEEEGVVEVERGEMTEEEEEVAPEELRRGCLSMVDRRLSSLSIEVEGAEEERGRRLFIVFCKASVPLGDVEEEEVEVVREDPEVLRRRPEEEGVEEEVEEVVEGAEVVERERVLGLAVIKVEVVEEEVEEGVALRAGEDLLAEKTGEMCEVGLGAEEEMLGEVVVLDLEVEAKITEER